MIYMALTDKLKQVKTKNDFITFINTLAEDNDKSSIEWENANISSFLNAVAAWTEDMDGYYNNMKKDLPKNINWEFAATLFYVGKIYE
jgi:hypothetical protein